MTGGAPPEAAQSLTESMYDLLAVSRASGSLQLAWGDVFEFGHDVDGYWAARLHRPGAAVLRAETARELGRLCADEFGAEAS